MPSGVIVVVVEELAPDAIEVAEEEEKAVVDVGTPGFHDDVAEDGEDKALIGGSLDVMMADGKAG